MTPEAAPVPSTEGRFVLERRLGSGAFGEVWLARDTRRRARVALKVLTRADGPSIVRFKRELRVLSDLQHPNLVRVYELLREGERWLLSMEWVPGRDLATSAPDLERWKPLLPQLAGALTALHGAGVVHRDVKPSNVRVDDEGRLVLLDFGLVAAFRDEREQGWAGSPAYMAPEQAAGSSPVFASDWYALGVMLFEAAVGHRPFEGHALEVLARKQMDPAPSVRELAPSTPPAWAALIDQLLLPDPQARMRGLSASLAAACGRPVELAAPAALAPLVGREREQRVLEAMLGEARAGVPGLACIVGPSGIGKTALLDWLTARAAEDGALVLRGRCHEQESLAHAGLDALVDELATELSHAERRPSVTELEATALRRIFPVLAPVLPEVSEPALDGPSLRRHAASGLRALWAEAAGRRTIVAIIDDIQWGDRDSAWLVAQCLANGAALVVTASRHREASMQAELVEAVAPHTTPRELPLGPLAARDVASLLSVWRLGELELAQRLHQQSGGHPFFVVELARTGLRDERRKLDAVALEGVLQTRLEQLDFRERSLLLALALAGRPLEPEVAARAFDLLWGRRDGAEAVLHGLTGLRSGRWIRTRHGLLELNHDRLAQAVRDAADDESVRALHGALEDALVEEDIDDPERWAHHALGAGRRERAAAALVEAGHRARLALAFHRSADFFARALELEVLDSEACTSATEMRARALADAGRNAEAAAAYASLLERAVPNEATHVEWARRCAEQWFHAGRPAEGYDALGRALRAAGLPPLRGPARVLASVLTRSAQLKLRGFGLRPSEAVDPADALRIDTCYSAALALTNMDSLRGVDFVLRSIEDARAAGDARRFARGLGMLANYACNGGGPAAARARWIIEGADRWARELDDRYVRGLVSGARVLLAYHNGRYRETCEHAERTVEIFEPMAGCARERVTAEIYRIVPLLMMGELDRARPYWRQLLEDGVARRDRFALTNARTGLMNVFWLAEGDPVRARQEAERAIAAWGEPSFHVQHFFDAVAQVRIDLYERRPWQALRRIERIRGPLRRSGLNRMQFVRVVSADLEARAWLQTLGDTDDRRALAKVTRRVTRISRAIHAEAMGWATPMARAHEAALHAARGDLAEAVTQAEAARAAFLEVEMGDHARALEVFVRRLVGDDGRYDWPAVADPTRYARALGPDLPLLDPR